MILKDDLCTCVGFINDEPFSETKINRIECDEKFEYNAIEGSREFGWAFDMIIPLQASDIFRGLISLDKTEATHISIQDGKLLFECKDESGHVVQKQYVLTKEKQKLNGKKYDATVAHIGMVGFKVFVKIASEITQKITQKKPANKLDKKDNKKQKTEDDVMQVQDVDITAKFDPDQPAIILSFQQIGLKGKIFVTTQVEQDN